MARTKPPSAPTIISMDGQALRDDERHGGADHQHAEAAGGLDDDVVEGHPAGVGGPGGGAVVHVLQLVLGHALLGRPAALA